jgi:hypothetical protein
MAHGAPGLQRTPVEKYCHTHTHKSEFNTSAYLQIKLVSLAGPNIIFMEVKDRNLLIVNLIKPFFNLLVIQKTGTRLILSRFKIWLTPCKLLAYPQGYAYPSLRITHL